MQGRPLPEQVADEVVQARDRLLVGNPFGDPLVVLDLGVDLHMSGQRAGRPIVSLSARSIPSRGRRGLRSPRADRSRRAVCDRAERNHRAPGALTGDCEKRKPRLGKRGLSVGLVRSVGRPDLKHYVEAGQGRVQKSEPAQIADGYSASMTLGLKLRHKIETTQHQGKANEAA